MTFVLRIAAIFAACACCGNRLCSGTEGGAEIQDRTPLGGEFSRGRFDGRQGRGRSRLCRLPTQDAALVLTREDVAEARLNQHELLMNDVLVQHYSVTLVLTKEARDRLAASCPGKSARVTVAVDGRYWGWHHYTTDNDAKISELSKAKNFNPSIGLMSSKSEAEHVIDAFK